MESVPLLLLPATHIHIRKRVYKLITQSARLRVKYVPRGALIYDNLTYIIRLKMRNFAPNINCNL